MSFFDELKRLAHPYGDEDDIVEEYEEEKEEERHPRLEDRRGGKVVSLHAASQLRVVLVKPERFDNAAEIADHLKEKRTVVLNLESTEAEAAKRIGRRLRRGRENQKNRRQYLFDYSVSCGYRGRSARRAGKQRIIFLIYLNYLFYANQKYF